MIMCLKEILILVMFSAIRQLLITNISGLDRSGSANTVAIAAPGTKAANYSFDVTPARLVTELITERGRCKADKMAIAELFPEYAHL